MALNGDESDFVRTLEQNLITIVAMRISLRTWIVAFVAICVALGSALIWRAKAMQQAAGVVELNSIGCVALYSVEHRALEQLDFESAAAQRPLAPYLDSVTYVSIPRQASVVDVVATCSKAFSSIEELLIESTKLSQDDIDAISKLSTIREVTLWSSNHTAYSFSSWSDLDVHTIHCVGDCVDDDSIQSLKDVSALRELTITSNRSLTRSGFRSVTECSHLTKVAVLQCQGFDEFGIRSLGDLAQLKTLRLDGVTLNHATGNAISDVKSLETFEFSTWDSDQEGRDALVSSIYANDKMSDVSIYGFEMSAEQVTTILRCNNLKRISLPDTPVHRTAVSRFPKKFAVEFRGLPLSTDRLFPDDS